MPSKKNALVWGTLVLSVFLMGVDSPEWQQKKLEFLKLAYRTYEFKQGMDYREAPHTLGKYFTEPIYQRLRGNDLMGFHYDEGFVLSGDAVQLTECKTTLDSARYGKAFGTVFCDTMKELKIEVKDGASCRVGACLVAVVEKMSSVSLPGVVLEVYAKNVHSGKKLFLRIKSGSRQGFSEAMRDAWLYVGLLLKASAINGKVAR